MDFGDLLNKFYLNFSTKNDLSDCKAPFLAERKLRTTNIKLKISIKLKNTGLMVIFRRLRLSTRCNGIFS